jgi:hypothetical protein
MTRSARSLFIFGLYVVAIGAALTFVPDLLLRVVKLPPVTDGWIRMVGVLSLVIGAYDIVAARNNLDPYIRASVPVRFAFVLACIALVLTHVMPMQLLMFAAVDAISATWTWLALRESGAARAA